jgi:hypothetical protein
MDGEKHRKIYAIHPMQGRKIVEPRVWNVLVAEDMNG